MIGTSLRKQVRDSYCKLTSASAKWICSFFFKTSNLPKNMNKKLWGKNNSDFIYHKTLFLSTFIF